MLLIDIGNTRIKAAYRVAGDWITLPTLATAAPDFARWAELPQSTDIKRVVVANVAGDVPAANLAAFLRDYGGPVEYAKPRVNFAGMRTAYRDPRQLGVDRWLAALAAFSDERAAVCVVDAGTALTVDIVEADGLHRGGLIAPGPELMRNSLVRGTAHLESAGIEQVQDFADNTSDAISLGCSEATRGLLRGVADRLRAKGGATSYRWYLTGGAAPLIAAISEQDWIEVPDLVLRGLGVYAAAT